MNQVLIDISFGLLTKIIFYKPAPEPGALGIQGSLMSAHDNDFGVQVGEPTPNIKEPLDSDFDDGKKII